MIILLLLNILVFNRVLSSDSESYEVNRLDSSPYYDNIIFSDVAQILNELGNNFNTPFDAFVNSYSESEEDVEDLLSEYQHYLEKAHKQRQSYLDKNKSKNKVPSLRHDRYSKAKPAAGAAMKYDNYYYANNYYPSFPQTPLTNPLDIFIPVNMKIKSSNVEGSTMETPQGGAPYEKLYDLQSTIHKSISDPVRPTCKHCIVSMNSGQAEQNKSFKSSDRKSFQSRVFDKAFTNAPQDASDNAVNIRIKVDIQMPKFENMGCNKSASHITVEQRDEFSKEKQTANSNVQFPFLNFPLPLELLGYKQSTGYSRHSQVPIRKITIHKKKKSRSNNNNKRHRKKMITFHNLNIEPQQRSLSIPKYDETFNIPEYLKKLDNKSVSVVNKTNIPLFSDTKTPLLQINASEYSNYTGNTDNTINLPINVTKNENYTEDARKTGNSIEIEYTTVNPNTTTTINITNTGLNSRKKREIDSSAALIPVLPLESKKPEKQLADSDLLYWPTNPKPAQIIDSKNITALILERENKKVKLNMSTESLHENRTRALEQAIFGNVDWDDVDTVAPVFMSFIGKYLKGVLTFCSESVCHSMKCGDKVCVHRICKPSERFNQMGHCSGSNSKDSTASMESIMDLPSNVAFEIVDILQERMLGKLFGKMTLCIGLKCITFVTSKKNFMISKCMSKQLCPAGHCTNMKNVKTA